MRFQVSAAAATALLAGVAVAEPLTVITPCPGATSTTVKPITVTKQYQEVSTCATTTACFRGSCTTKYPLQTYAYVNTVIPAAWNGKEMQTTTVTSTTQTVTVSRFQSTLTKWVTPAVTSVSGTTKHPRPTPIYLTIAKDFFAPYNKLGPLAIPGYGGSGLCKECETQPDGSRSQVVGVVECRAGPGGSKCMGYDETWISKPAPSTSATTANACSTRWVAPSAGTYTFTFPFVAPARTITAAETTITVGPVPYWARVTRVCHRAHEVVDFTTTITKTIYWTAPCSRQPPRTSSAVPVPTGKHAFPGWPRPGRGNDANGGIDGSHGDPYSWADWGSDDAADPNKPIPSGWADWVATATTPVYTSTTSSSVTQGPTGQSTTTTSLSYSTSSQSYSSSSSSSSGPIDQSTTTSSGLTTTSTSSFSSTQGPIDQSTTTSSGLTTTSTSSFSSTQGPIDQSTTTSSGLTTTSTSSFSSTQGPIDQSTTTSSGSTTSGDSTTSTVSTASSFSTTSVDSTASTASTTSSISTTSVDSTTSTESTTSSFSTTSVDSTTSTESTTSSFSTTSVDSTTSTESTTSSISTTSVDSTTSTESTTSSFSTTSVDSTTSTITSFTTSSVTTTSASTTTSLVVIPVNPNNFVIGVNSATKYRKRALRYVKFSAGGDAVLTTDKADASAFSLEDGYLKSGDQFVDADTTQPWLSFSLSVTLSGNTSKWSIGSDGTLSLQSANIGLCVAADQSVFIQFSSNTPFLCLEIVLVAEVPNPTTSTTSTTSFIASTTFSAPTTTTTSFDPSGDLDADIPAPTNVRRGVHYGGPRFGRRRH